MLSRIAPPWTRRREVLRRVALKPAADPVLRRWHRWAYAHDDVFFVQIGSNDGLRGDPLSVHVDRQPGWNGIMVEPVPEMFERLRERRSTSRIRCVQAAITGHDGTVAITTFADPERDRSLMTTLEAHVAASYGDVPTVMVEVPAMTFASLTQDVADIDVLHVDTEGHDAKILAQVDFDAWSMRAVLFEHAHLDPAEHSSIMETLHSSGFATWSNEVDTLCVR